MKYNQVGNSDLEISEIGFGCMSLPTDENTSIPLLRNARERGINFFDTADLYDKGFNEEMVGKALKPFRDEVMIATKVGNVWRKDGSGWDWNPSKEHILLGIDESLRRLQTDYIDLYMLHGGTIKDPIDEIIETFERLKKQGKIRAYGISSIRPNVIREYVEKSDMDAIMMQYSLLDRRPEEKCLDLLAENNISVLTRGTLAKGMLIDKKATDYLGYSRKEVQNMQQAIQQTGQPLAASIQYVLNHPAVSSAVTGIRTEAQLKDILEHYKDQISEENMENLAEVLQPNIYQKHR